MNQTDIYRKAIQRTFAELYSVPAESVDVVFPRCDSRAAQSVIYAAQLGARGFEREFLMTAKDCVALRNPKTLPGV